MSNKQYVVQVYRFANNMPNWVTMTPLLTRRDAKSLMDDFERDNPGDVYRLVINVETRFKTEKDVK